MAYLRSLIERCQHGGCTSSGDRIHIIRAEVEA